MSVIQYVGDARDKLQHLADNSINCCITSPPYFGLRDYGCEGQMGLEPTPDEFVAGMVAVFREVRRVLRDDGTLWLNIGDSYASQGGGMSVEAKQRSRAGTGNNANIATVGRVPPQGCKAKDLIGIPWMLAFALRADGWYLRQDIIWHKPNPMPESVRDRCTKSHEYIFMFSKSARYYYDADAIKEPSVMKPQNRNTSREKHPKGDEGRALHRRPEGGTRYDMRNKRSVWSVPTRSFKGAHFATFPPALIEPCILAGCPVGGTVLDPFGGAGTTGLVADALGRNAVLVELNPEYARMAEQRITDAGGRVETIQPIRHRVRAR